MKSTMNATKHMSMLASTRAANLAAAGRPPEKEKGETVKLTLHIGIGVGQVVIFQVRPRPPARPPPHRETLRPPRAGGSLLRAAPRPEQPGPGAPPPHVWRVAAAGAVEARPVSACAGGQKPRRARRRSGRRVAGAAVALAW